MQQEGQADHGKEMMDQEACANRTPRRYTVIRKTDCMHVDYNHASTCMLDSFTDSYARRGICLLGTRVEIANLVDPRCNVHVMVNARAHLSAYQRKMRWGEAHRESAEPGLEEV